MIGQVKANSVRAATAAVTLSLALSGCASKLPGPEAEAFRIIAETNRTAFVELSDEHLAAQTRFAKRAILTGDGTVVVDPGCNLPEKGACIVTYRLADSPVRLNQSPAKAIAVLGSLSRYGASMAELAEAKDLDTVNTKAGAAAGAAKSLILTVAPGAGIVAPIIDLALLAAKSSLREKRRAALLRVAEAADPGIRDAAALFDGMLKPMRRDIELNATQEVTDIQRRMVGLEIEERAIAKIAKPTAAQQARLATLRQRRADDLELLIGSAGKVNAVREIDIEFATLAEAHAELVEKLRNPDTDTQELFENLNQVLVLIDQIEAATQKDP